MKGKKQEERGILWDFIKMQLMGLHLISQLKLTASPQGEALISLWDDTQVAPYGCGGGIWWRVKGEKNMIKFMVFAVKWAWKNRNWRLCRQKKRAFLRAWRKLIQVDTPHQFGGTTRRSFPTTKEGKKYDA